MKKIFINSIIATVMLFNFSIANVFANDEHNLYDIITTQNGITYELWSDGSFTANSVIDIFSSAKIIKIPNSISYNNKTYEIDTFSFYKDNGKCTKPKSSNTCEKLIMNNVDVFMGISKWNNLKEIHVSKVYTYFGCINNCKKLQKIFISGSKDTDTSTSDISNNKNLRVISYKDIYQIETKAVYNCPKLQSVIFSSNIENIDTKAFIKCNNLSKVIFKNVKESSYIDTKAFSKCKKLSKVIFKNVKKLPYIDENAFKNTKKGIKFVVKNKKVAKQLKKQLKESGVRNARILVGKKVVYQNING